jgi:hypothetical protein
MNAADVIALIQELPEKELAGMMAFVRREFGLKFRRPTFDEAADEVFSEYGGLFRRFACEFP